MQAAAAESLSIPHLLRTARDDEESAAHLKRSVGLRVFLLGCDADIDEVCCTDLMSCVAQNVLHRSVQHIVFGEGCCRDRRDAHARADKWLQRVVETTGYSESIV